MAHDIFDSAVRAQKVQVSGGGEAKFHFGTDIVILDAFEIPEEKLREQPEKDEKDEKSKEKEPKVEPLKLTLDIADEEVSLSELASGGGKSSSAGQSRRVLLGRRLKVRAEGPPEQNTNIWITYVMV